MDSQEKNILLFGGLAIAGLLFFTQSAKAVNTAIDTVIHYSLTQDQGTKILQLHPAVRQQFYNFIRDIQEKLGYNVKITSGYRTFQDQIRLHNENSSNAKPGYSMHNYGMAIDINLQKGTQVIKKASPKTDWINSGVVALGEKHGLYWGGQFSNYYDPVHFDTRKQYSIDTLRQKAIKQFGSVENARGNEVTL